VLAIDRVGCTGLLANQLRVLMTAACLPMLEIHLAASLTSLVRAQAWTMRERLLKLGARVVSSVRRLVIHLPEAFVASGLRQLRFPRPGRPPAL